MKKYLKFLFSFFAICFLMSLSTTASAAEKQTSLIDENATLLYQGYTEDGIKYEVYENPESKTPNMVTPDTVITQYVTRYIRYYSATITPTQQVFWQENLDSYTVMSGWLTWTGAYLRNYIDNYTDATYTGYLTGNI
ncbi:hypothetical protein SAMN02745136_04122 [Anaerocolumna jejuensis DSM 15929]|uniref:Uncharacterized protein n=1 Tax=Anaerocolumna jejuensis DSM 15929 TaxID=1121322 RepID=A0A1M6XZ41_9FIRM|nr:hypothetical protein [Anaerocolumna jejuensis]SHL11113.1 hypothetical protein SAMN02745136_04122 [Anaerocolumna jejuensis DSM 15929]